MQGTKKKLFTKASVYLLGEPVHTLQKPKILKELKETMGSTGNFPNDPSVLVSKSTTCLINWLVQTQMQGLGGKSTASVSSESTYRTYKNNVENNK
jgi:hypothetical protein